jgi:SAM-dependent methyltransferase/pimeloyl-ACP methyl ester carboxylesterase
MFRTRFKNEIVAEFLPPARPRKKQRLIILCDGMPSIPRKQPLSEFLAAKGYWVIYPRYRGAWESHGEFLAKSPNEDILDVLDELPKELEEIAFGQRFRLSPDQVFVIGGSFGGAAAILLSLDPRVKRVIANCAVVDWSILDTAEKAETSKANYADYIREAFGGGYRLSDANWRKLRSGTFYNPWQHRNEIDGSKVMMFHAKDDPNVPYARARELAEITGAKLKTFKRGGHISTDYVVRKYWQQIRKFFDSARNEFIVPESSGSVTGDQTRAMRHSYDQIADEYARRIYHELEGKPFDRELLSRFAKAVGVKREICDMGCGPGHIARYLQSLGASVSGLDISPAMVKQARLLNPGIRFQVGDMLALDLPDCTLAAIVAFYAIVNIPKQSLPTIFREMFRVLQARGQLLLAFHIGDGAAHYDELWDRPISMDFFYFQPAEIRGCLEAAGFAIEEVNERQPYAPEVEHQSHRAYIWARKP